MCTLSIITLASDPGPHLVGVEGFRVVMSRDELRERPAALQPRWRPIAESPQPHRAIWPTDPKGGGTWIGATEAGLVFCLLNLNLEPVPTLPTGLISRGTIIPRLLRGPGPLSASLQSLDLDRFAPFRLVMVAPDRPERTWTGRPVITEARWDRQSLRLTDVADTAACFVSSGLGDSRVTRRLSLFRGSVGEGPSPRAQDEFHQHTWPGSSETSVLMSRPDARTVSITTVEVLRRPGGVHTRMTYRPVEDACLPTAAIPAP